MTRLPKPLVAVAVLGVTLARAPRLAAEEMDRAPVPIDDVQAVDTIVVTGSRTQRPLSDAPVATELITRRDVEESGARNLAELLDEHAGLYLERSFAGAGVQLEGLPPDYTLILVDGVRVPGRIGGVLDLSRFSTEDVERVEIVRGAGSALYGSDAIAGVINVITRKPQRTVEVSGQAGAGQLGRRDGSAELGLSRDGAAAHASAGYHAAAAFDRDLADVATTGSAFEQYNAAGRVELELGPGFRLSATGDYRRRDAAGVDLSAGGAVFDRTNVTETATVLLAPEWRWGDGSQLRTWASFGLFRDQFRLDQREAGALDELTDTRENLAQLGSQLDWALAGSHLLTLGSEGSLETLRTARLNRGRAERRRGAVYAQDEWVLLGDPLVVLLPGARLDVDSQFGAYATPRIALRFDPLEQLTLRASLGLGFKAPDFRELYLLFENPGAGYLVEGSPELRPERSKSARVSLEASPGSRIWLSLAAFVSQLGDRITTDLAGATDGGPRRFRYRNVDSALSRGVEASLRVSPLGGLRLDFGYSVNQTRDESTGQPIAGQPLHRGTARLRYRHDGVGFETTWRAAFVGTRAFFDDVEGEDQPRRVDADGYASVDLRVAQRVGEHVKSFLLAENLLDAGDAEYLFLPPRTFSGGVRLDY